tara:strand:+ start:887 stop:1411 length:525 start_codon:yes stop_codon:yes gene_type:complete
MSTQRRLGLSFGVLLLSLAITPGSAAQGLDSIRGLEHLHICEMQDNTCQRLSEQAGEVLDGYLESTPILGREDPFIVGLSGFNSDEGERVIHVQRGSDASGDTRLYLDEPLLQIAVSNRSGQVVALQRDGELRISTIDYWETLSLPEPTTGFVETSSQNTLALPVGDRKWRRYL